MSWIFFFFQINLFLILETKNSLSYPKELSDDLNQNKIYDTINTLRNLESINTNKKNLILGFITGYTWPIIKPFFISLISTNIKNYDLVIFADKLSDETIKKIKLCGAIIKDIPEKHLFGICKRK